MNMNMKNEKTMLALILVAALAMVSVAGVALASESSDAKIIVDTNKTIVDAEGYNGDLDVAVGSTLEIIGNYSGTVTFYDNTDKDVRSVITCTNVSGISFINGKATIESVIAAVTVIGETDGTITLDSGTLTLGDSTSSPKVSYMGTLTVSTYGTIISGMTCGATVTIVPAAGTVAEYVAISGNIAVDSDVEVFESADNGITNEMLGNDLNIYTEKDTTGNPISYIAGVLSKIDINGASAVGTAIVTEYTTFASGYGIIVNETFNEVTINATTGALECAALTTLGYDLSKLTVADTVTSAKVTGITGALTINIDATISESIAATATIINNNDLTVAGTTASPASVTINGLFINNGDIKVTSAVASIAGTGSIINYGTFTADAQSITCPNLSGYYVETTTTTMISGSTVSVVSVKGYATLADAVAAATGATDVIVAGGYVYNTENVTIASTQTIRFQGAGGNALFALDGTGSLTIAGTAINYTGVNMIIASEASMDLSASTTKIGTPATGIDFMAVEINANGTLIVRNGLLSAIVGEEQLILNFGTVSADTKDKGTTTTTFDNLYNALTNTTTAKSEVTLLRGATLNKSATLATDVTFDNAGFGLTIAEDVIFTVNGHFQFICGADEETALTINGMLIINDDTTPVTTSGSEAGSFIADKVAVTLAGGIQISEGAKFLNEADFTITADAGVISVEGTFTNKGSIGSSATDLLLALNIAANGVLINDGTIYAKIAAISGTLDNTSGTVTVDEIYVTGTVKAGTAGITVDSLAGFGTASTPLASTAVTGTITLGNEAYAIVYGSALTSKIFAATVVSTDFIIDDEVYATEYATGSGTTPTTTVLLDLLTVDISGKKLVGWYDSPDFNGKMITVNNKAVIGEYVAVYGNLVDKTVTVSFAYTQNGTWVLDGQNIGASGNITLAVGTHTIAFVADNGYELSNYAVTVNQVTISSTSYNFQNDTNAVAYSGEVKEKSTDGGLDLVTILLIIITIVIIIMAIIIALKLMRS